MSPAQPGQHHLLAIATALNTYEIIHMSNGNHCSSDIAFEFKRSSVAPMLEPQAKSKCGQMFLIVRWHTVMLGSATGNRGEVLFITGWEIRRLQLWFRSTELQAFMMILVWGQSGPETFELAFDQRKIEEMSIGSHLKLTKLFCVDNMMTVWWKTELTKSTYLEGRSVHSFLMTNLWSYLTTLDERFEHIGTCRWILCCILNHDCIIWAIRRYSG